MKESLFILKKNRNKKNFTFSGEKYVKFFHPTSLVPSRLPQQVIYHLPKSHLKQDESLINNLHLKKKFTKIGQLVQKLQQLMPFFIRNPTLCINGVKLPAKFQLCKVSVQNSRHNLIEMNMWPFPFNLFFQSLFHWIVKKKS